VSDPELSIVIPAYDEAQRLPPTLARIAGWIESAGIDCEVVVVDDGSSDGTAERARESLESFSLPNQVLVHEQNQGKGAGLRTGMTAARGRYVLFSDADLSTPIEEASRFLEAHEQGVPIVIGTRKSKGARVLKRQNPIRENMGKVYTLLSNVLICPGISDFTCGFKSFRQDACQAIFSRLRENGWAYDTEVLYLARRLGYEVREIPVEWVNDPSSRVNLLRDTLGSFAGLMRIRGRALRGAYGIGDGSGEAAS